MADNSRAELCPTPGALQPPAVQSEPHRPLLNVDHTGKIGARRQILLPVDDTDVIHFAPLTLLPSICKADKHICRLVMISKTQPVTREKSLMRSNFVNSSSFVLLLFSSLRAVLPFFRLFGAALRMVFFARFLALFFTENHALLFKVENSSI